MINLPPHLWKQLVEEAQRNLENNPPTLGEQPHETRPAFRTEDAIAGLGGYLLTQVLGGPKAAQGYGAGYLGGKLGKAQRDSQRSIAEWRMKHQQDLQNWYKKQADLGHWLGNQKPEIKPTVASPDGPPWNIDVSNNIRGPGLHGISGLGRIDLDPHRPSGVLANDTAEGIKAPGPSVTKKPLSLSQKKTVSQDIKKVQGQPDASQPTPTGAPLWKITDDASKVIDWWEVLQKRRQWSSKEPSNIASGAELMSGLQNWRYDLRAKELRLRAGRGQVVTNSNDSLEKILEEGIKLDALIKRLAKLFGGMSVLSRL